MCPAGPERNRGAGDLQGGVGCPEAICEGLVSSAYTDTGTVFRPRSPTYTLKVTTGSSRSG
jgi:hypothetical protein